MRSVRMQGIERELKTRWMGHPLTVLDTVDSTNRYLKQRVSERRSMAGEAVWADAQTAGRGRLGRQWASPEGRNIYTSVLWTPPRERMSGVLSLVAGVGVVHAVRAATGLDARLKWPNDVVVAGRKFCGILVEAGVDPTPWAVVGIGINVIGKPDPQFPHATTLQEQTRAPVSREDLWLHLMASLEGIYDQWIRAGDSWAAEAWSQCTATLGQMVRVERPGAEPWIGRAERIDADGGLWVTASDRQEKVISGEVSLRLADGRYAP